MFDGSMPKRLDAASALKQKSLAAIEQARKISKNPTSLVFIGFFDTSKSVANATERSCTVATKIKIIKMSKYILSDKKFLKYLKLYKRILSFVFIRYVQKVEKMYFSYSDFPQKECKEQFNNIAKSLIDNKNLIINFHYGKSNSE